MKTENHSHFRIGFVICKMNKVSFVKIINKENVNILIILCKNNRNCRKLENIIFLLDLYKIVLFFNDK